MRLTLLRLLTVLICAIALPVCAAPAPEPPHAWLFGTWIGGLYPLPVTLGAEQCLSQPVVIFTRDMVLRASLLDEGFAQRRIDTVRATATGAEFRFYAASGPATTGAPTGFGCENADVLHVRRINENEISFPRCVDFPYPLVRCPNR